MKRIILILIVLLFIGSAIQAKIIPILWNGVQGPLDPIIPIAITLSPASVTIPDNTHSGTVLTMATVTMSNGSQFPGTLTSSDTTGFFAVSGLNIVTGRTLTSADDGTHSTTITATMP